MSGETLFSYILVQQITPACTPWGFHLRSKQANVKAPSTPLLPSLGGWRRWLGPLAIAVPPRLAVVTFVEALAVVVTVAISHENGGAMEEREVEGGECFGDVFFLGELMVDERFG